MSIIKRGSLYHLRQRVPFLPFLVKYRKIVEGITVQDAKLETLRHLGQEHQQIQIALGGDIARRYVLEQLQSLPGCGFSVAQKLLEAGYQSPEEIRRAGRGELMKIKGIGPKLAATLISDE